MTDRPSTTLLHLTPHLLARIETLGFGGAPSDALAWLVGDAEKLRRSRDFHVAHLDAIRAVLSDPSRVVDGGFDSAGKVAAMARELQAVKAARDEARATAEELRLTLAAEQGKFECLPFSSPPRLRAAVNAERILRGLSWRELAAQIGVSSSGFTRWNAGHDLSVPVYLKVCDWLRAAMIAADKALGQPDQQPAPERRRPHRSLIHVLDVIDDRVMLSIPGWRSRWFVERTLDVFAPDLRATVARDRYYFGLVNIGAESSDDLAIEVTELAPEPDPADGPDAVEAENAGCPSSLLLTLTPHLKARIEALGYVPGETPAGVLPWLVALAEGQRATLSAPVEGVNLEEVLRLDREATPGPWVASSDQEPTRVVAGVDAAPSYQQPGQTWIAGHEAGGRSIRLSEANAKLIATYRTAAPALAREVQRLRLEVADLRTHHIEALTAAGAPLTDGDGKTLSDLQRVAYLSDLVDDGKARHLFQRLVERTAAALGLDKERLDPETGQPYLPSWHDIPEQVEQLVKRSAARKTP